MYSIKKTVFVLSTRHAPVFGGGGKKMEPTHPLFMILTYVCLFLCRLKRHVAQRRCWR